MSDLREKVAEALRDEADRRLNAGSVQYPPSAVETYYGFADAILALPEIATALAFAKGGPMRSGHTPEQVSSTDSKSSL